MRIQPNPERNYEATEVTRDSNEKVSPIGAGTRGGTTRASRKHPYTYRSHSSDAKHNNSLFRLLRDSAFFQTTFGPSPRYQHQRGTFRKEAIGVKPRPEEAALPVFNRFLSKSPVIE